MKYKSLNMNGRKLSHSHGKRVRAVLTAATISLLWAAGPSTADAAILPPNPEWKQSFGNEAVGVMHFGDVEKARGVLVTLSPGKIVVLNAHGQKQQSMKLDLPVETPAVATALKPNEKLSVVAVDAAGSIYCFDESGQRKWKFTRSVKSGEFRLPVFADLDGSGEKEILVTDSRGSLQALDGQGHLRLEIKATKYRLSMPAVLSAGTHGKARIIFGTEAGEVYCIKGRGELEWARQLDGCFGRALPVIADPKHHGNPEVYFPTAFNNAHPGLFALDAITGKNLWKAPSILQSYRSTAVADLDGSGRSEILFGDKNSTLFCLDDAGWQLWKNQLPGRGIFFAPAIAALQGPGPATSFVVVRGASSDGKSLYAVNSSGEIAYSRELSGGGGGSPLLCRFADQSNLSLLVLSGGGELACYEPEQNPVSAEILWPGIGNNFVQSKSGRTQSRKTLVAPALRKAWPVFHKSARCGTNWIDIVAKTKNGDLMSIRTIRPDKSISLELIHLQPGATEIQPSFVAAEPGTYDVTVSWRTIGYQTDSGVDQAQHFIYRLDRDYKHDAKELAEATAQLHQIGTGMKDLAKLTEYFQEKGRRLFESARRIHDLNAFDELHAQCDYALALARYCRQGNFFGPILVQQISDFWENFKPVEFFSRTEPPDTNRKLARTINVQMLGNAYESAAIAVNNLREKPAAYRVDCGQFELGTNRVDASEVLVLRDVVQVRPDGTGDLTEDPLPLLNEAHLLKLEPGGTRKLWLTFHSKALEPGNWRALLRLIDVAGTNAPVEVPITLQIYPVRLPERFTYRECNWLYLQNIGNEAAREATLRDALDHGMNVFAIPGVSVSVDQEGHITGTNTTVHDGLVSKLRGKAFFLISGPVSIQWPAGAHPTAPLREKLYADTLSWYAEHMRSLGCDYRDYAIYLQDEPGLLGENSEFDDFVARVKQFKKAAPRMQLYANPAGGATAELLRPLQDLIDVWAPDLHLVHEQPEELREIFKHGKHFWHYEAPADQRTLHPLGFYRMKPWVAFQLGMTGGGYWVYSQANFWDAPATGGSEYGTVYPTDKGPVTTKRWEASREGIQDFELLWMVRETAKNAAPGVREEALQLLNKAVTFVTRGQEKVTDISRHVRPYTPDYQQWMRHRSDLIQMEMKMADGIDSSKKLSN